MKRCTLRWLGHVEKMENEEFIKKVSLSSVEGPNRRGRPLGRWEDRVKEYVSEKEVRGNGLEWARGSVRIRRGGGPSFMATTLGDTFQGSEVLELLTERLSYVLEF